MSITQTYLAALLLIELLHLDMHNRKKTFPKGMLELHILALNHFVVKKLTPIKKILEKGKTRRK